MLEPNAIIFYVDDINKSHQFYEELLGIHPETSAPSFRMFRLSNNMGLGLKDKQEQQLANGPGNNELAFTVTNPDQVDRLFLDWQQKGITVVEPPAPVTFGYTFTAIDPDGNRLRVVSLG